MVQSGNQEPTCTCSPVSQNAANLRVYLFNSKVGNSTVGIEFTHRSRALQTTKQSFIHIVEVVCSTGIFKVNFIEQIHDITEKIAILHIVSGIAHDIFDQKTSVISFIERNLLNLLMAFGKFHFGFVGDFIAVLINRHINGNRISTQSRNQFVIYQSVA